MGRLDWQPTGKDHVFVRYIYQDDPFLGTYGDSSNDRSGWPENGTTFPAPPTPSAATLLTPSRPVG